MTMHCTELKKLVPLLQATWWTSCPFEERTDIVIESLQTVVDLLTFFFIFL